MGMMTLPGPLQELWNVWREIEGKASQAMTLALVGAPDPERHHWRDALLIGSRNEDSLRLIDAVETAPPLADIYLVLVTTGSGNILHELPVLKHFEHSKLAIALVGIPEHLISKRQREIAHTLDIGTDQVIPVMSLKELAESFAASLFERFPDLVIPLSRQFPIFRSAASWQEIQATAKQNGLIGVLPLPGADMPIMTANQIKMILRMAAMFDMPMSIERVRELLAVAGGGFALRTVARELIKFIPGPGWVVAGGIGYSGTLTMGKAALEYLRRVSPSHHVAASSRTLKSEAQESKA